MDSALSVITATTTTALFKAVNRHFSGSQCVARPVLHRRLNYCANLRLQCVTSSASSSGAGNTGDSAGAGAGELSALPPHVIILDVRGMMCEGCAANVKRILESRPQVSSVSVNLTTEIAIVWPVSEAKTAPNWQKQLGEALAEHLTSCGFNSSLQGQEDSN